jgi:hypothetical protein
MDNWLIFQYCVSRAITEGGTGKGRGTMALVVHGQGRRKSHRKIRDSLIPRADVSLHCGRVLDPMPPRKSSREWERTRTKTDTGRQVEHTKVIEKTLVKELGKMAP